MTAVYPALTPADPQTLLFIGGALLVAAAIGFVVTPLAAFLARRVHAMDHPDSPRRVHGSPVPRAGGLAIALTFVIVGSVAVALGEGQGGVASGRTIHPVQLGVL